MSHPSPHCSQLADHLRQVFFGGNWTWSNLRDQLADVTWEEAVRPVNGFNNIVTLTYHIRYFVAAVLPVLRGGRLDAHDKFSFDHPPIHAQADWDTMLAAIWDDVEAVAALVADLPESRLWEEFTDPKYGNYYRNILGLIEHTHYHLGQIAFVKKAIRQGISAQSL